MRDAKLYALKGLERGILDGKMWHVDGAEPAKVIFKRIQAKKNGQREAR